MLLELGIHRGALPATQPRNKKVRLAGGQPLLVAGVGTAPHIFNRTTFNERDDV